MSQHKFRLQYNGQGVEQDDMNDLGEVAGFADDRVLAELFRMRPWNGSAVSKGIIPYGHASAPAAGTVAPNGASGSVLVHPFRALVGSRTGETAQKTWQDIRSNVSIADADSSSDVTVAIAANASGFARWDLVYAVLAIDVNGNSVTRKIKDAGTGVVSEVTTATYLKTTVTVPTSPIAGTAAASPVFPAITADGGSTFYIPLAYILVPNGFGASSTVSPSWICCQAPVISIAAQSGAQNMQVANQSYVLTTAQQTAYTNSGRQSFFLPPDLAGGETLLLAVDLSDASSANHSHANNAVLDNRDWRGRLCWWKAEVYTSTQKLPWDPTISLTATAIAFDGHPGDYEDSNSSSKPIGAGQTIVQNNNAAVAQTSLVAFLSSDNCDGIAASAEIGVYCDHSDGGKLKLSKTVTNPRAIVVLRLDFTSAFRNVR